MKKNTKVLLGSCAIMLSILAMLVIATPATSGAEVEIDEVTGDWEQFADRYITTEGVLVPDSVKWNAEETVLHFDIKDEDSGVIIPVVYHGVQPDNFNEDVMIIVHGYMQEDGVFEAEKVQTRCPSTYEGIDPDEYDPEMHKNMNLDHYDPELHP